MTVIHVNTRQPIIPVLVGGETLQAPEFYNRVTLGGGDVVKALPGLLEERGIRYCVTGGHAVNNYVEPLVSLDLVIAAEQLEQVEGLLADRYTVRRFPHRLNVDFDDSDLRIRIQTDPLYGDFVERAEAGVILGMTMPVAAAGDVLRGKVLAAQDPSRRASKRQKDLADISRLVETIPALRGSVPAEVLQKIES